MERITQAEVRRPFVLYVEYEVKLADEGAPVWPNGVDIAPEGLHEHLRRAGATPERA